MGYVTDSLTCFAHFRKSYRLNGNLQRIISRATNSLEIVIDTSGNTRGSGSGGASPLTVRAYIAVFPLSRYAAKLAQHFGKLAQHIL